MGPSTPTTSTSACLIASWATHRLAVAAEIDCVDDSGAYVELKTNKLLASKRLVGTFERFKMFKFWVQSYLVGTPKVIVGFRDEDELRKVASLRHAGAAGPRRGGVAAAGVPRLRGRGPDVAPGSARRGRRRRVRLPARRSRNARDFVRPRRRRRSDDGVDVLFLCSAIAVAFASARRGDGDAAQIAAFAEEGGRGRRRAQETGRDGSGRRPRPPRTPHSRARVGKGRQNLSNVPRETVAVLFCWFRRLAVVGPGRQGGLPRPPRLATAALATVSGCRRERARARQRAGAGWPRCAPHDQPSSRRVHRRFPGRSARRWPTQPRSALDRGPPHWTGRAGLRALGKAQRTSQLCVRKRVATENLSKRDRDAAHRECQFLKTLDHPSIVKFVESFEGRLEDDARCLHLVMEWCPQGDLAYHINEAKNTSTKFKEQQIGKWFAQMGDALLTCILHSRSYIET